MKKERHVVKKLLAFSMAAILPVASGMTVRAEESDDSSSDSGKEETVYVFTDASGNPQKTLVSNWLKNPDGSQTLTDTSDLSDITNVEGDETYTQSGNKLTWQADGDDIYYQGTTSKQAPVSVKLSYQLDGKDISEASEQRKVKIGFTIEAPAFYGGLTGKQNLCLLADLYPDLPKDAVNRSLETVGLRENANVKVKNYSLGMKQRLYLAYAILNEPTVLILDEPFNGIDPVSVKIFKDLLKSFAQKGATVLISSHSILDIQSVCDRVIILDRGRIAYDCSDVQNENLEEKFFEITGASGSAQ